MSAGFIPYTSGSSYQHHNAPIRYPPHRAEFQVLTLSLLHVAVAKPLQPETLADGHWDVSTSILDHPVSQVGLLSPNQFLLAGARIAMVKLAAISFHDISRKGDSGDSG